MKEEIRESIKALSDKEVLTAAEPVHAMQLTQAVMNLAQALVTLESIDKVDPFIAQHMPFIPVKDAK